MTADPGEKDQRPMVAAPTITSSRMQRRQRPLSQLGLFSTPQGSYPECGAPQKLLHARRPAPPWRGVELADRNVGSQVNQSAAVILIGMRQEDCI